jgi:hypothetical protein
MAKVNQQIVGLGGHGNTPAQTRALMRHVLALTGNVPAKNDSKHT